MSKFKVGDKVVRLKPDTDHLIPSTTEVHEITQVGGGRVALKSFPILGLYWRDYRFELYKEPVVDQETKKPHVHAECIKAWADGIQVQFKPKGDTVWHDLGNSGWCSWDEKYQYRIKPEPKPDVLRYGVATTGNGMHAEVGCLGPNNTNPNNNLKLTFDGETGCLKSAEVI